MFRRLTHFFQTVGKRTAKQSVQARSTASEELVQSTTADELLKLANTAVGYEDFSKAAILYEASAVREPTRAAPYIGLGFSMLNLGRHMEAEGALFMAVKLDPNSADGFYMLGQLSLARRDRHATKEHWYRAQSLDPALEHLYLEFCHLLFSSGEASQAMHVVQKGLQVLPRSATLHFIVGNLEAEIGNFDRAADAYESARKHGMQTPELLSNFANSLRQLGHLDTSLKFAHLAHVAQPESAEIFSSYLFTVQYSDALTKEEKYKVHCEFAERFEKPLAVQWGSYVNERSASRKLRIGYVSGDFRNHSLCFFFEPIIALHDHARFEVICFHNYPSNDEVTHRLQKHADRWVPCFHLNDDELARTVRELKIDVLIDLSGHTGHNRLLTFARKPAPVQMTWLGYQSTTGLRAIDYRITDEALDPIGASEHLHSEKLLRLPSSGTFMGMPNGPAVTTLPALSGQPFTYGCLNNPSKITDDVAVLWARILHEAVSARLLIGNATPALKERVTSMFSKHGICTARLLFRPKVPLTEYLALHGEVDLALDTFPYNGGTTTFHSLWMGVPVIALQGETALSNVGVSVMRGLKLSEFCATTPTAYVEQAVYFSEHLAELAAVRGALREKVTALGGNLSREVTHHLERAYLQCWAEFCGQPH